MRWRPADPVSLCPELRSLAALTRLRKVTIDGFHMQVDDVAWLFEAQQLKTLYIMNCSLSEDEVVELVRRVGAHDIRITTSRPFVPTTAQTRIQEMGVRYVGIYPRDNLTLIIVEKFR